MASMSAVKNLDGEDELCAFAMQLASSAVVPMALKAAAELKVLEIISRAGPGAQMSAVQIASHLPTQNPKAPSMLDRLLRLLASHSVLTCRRVETSHGGRTQRVYGLAPGSKFFVADEHEASLVPMLESINDKNVFKAWLHFKDAIIEGKEPFYMAHGMRTFDYIAKHPENSKSFNKSMSSHSTLFTRKLLENYRGFEALKELVDVGGGLGSVLNMIISKYPHIKGINFDLPHVVADAPPYSGIEHIGGDMFITVPRGEAIFMKFVLHDWGDEECVQILKNCYRALPDHGKVLVAESVLPNDIDTSVATKNMLQFDTIMLSLFNGGEERSANEFKALANRAGFAGVKVACCVCNITLVEFHK